MSAVVPPPPAGFGDSPDHKPGGSNVVEAGLGKFFTMSMKFDKNISDWSPKLHWSQKRHRFLHYMRWPKIAVDRFLEWGYQIGNTEIDKIGDSPVFEIDRWNFQQMLDFRFSETSQNLSSFKQILFSSFSLNCRVEQK